MGREKLNKTPGNFATGHATPQLENIPFCVHVAIYDDAH